MRYPLVFIFLITTLPVRFITSQISWTKHTITDDFGGACSVHAEDITDDGLVDVLGAGWDLNTVALWTNSGGNPITWTRQNIDTLFYGVSFVNAGDVDGDEDIDVLASAWHGSELAWWENDGGNPIQWTKHIIDAASYNAHEIAAADMDGDDDLDVLSAVALTDEIVWFENNGLNPPGWTKHVVSDSFDGARSVKAVDFDDDGLLDVVGAALLANAVTWWHNNGDTTWTEYILDSNFGMSHMVYAPDIDDDGDSDIVAVAYTSNDVAWWRNDGGSPVQFTKQTIDPSLFGALGVFAEDINNDGHLDVLGTADITDDVVWYSNSGVSPISWTKYIIDGNCNGAWPVYAADLDNDGDIDALAAANASDAIYWYENGLIGIGENDGVSVDVHQLGATIIRGPIRLPQGSDFRILDICGREITPNEMRPGIFFIQNGETICRKIIKIQ